MQALHRLAGAVLASALLAAGSAHAATFAASELSNDAALLSQFNLVSLGDYNTDNRMAYTTNGRVIIGGNANYAQGHVCYDSSSNCVGNSTKAIDSTGQLYGAVTVFGNITGSVLLANGGGDVSIGGAASGFVSQGTGKLSIVGSTAGFSVATNATSILTTQSTFTSSRTNQPASGPSPATPQVSQTLASVFPFSMTGIKAETRALYSGLANLPGSPGVTAQALPATQSGVFTSGTDYTANGKSYGVVTTTIANLAGQGSGFTGVANGAGNAATFVIVTGDGANYLLPSLTTSDSKVLYDFVGATTLKLGGAFDGSILAPLANLTTSTTGAINGSVVVASMTQDQALYNGNAFTGDLSGLTGFGYNSRVPEPGSLFLLGAALAALAFVRARQQITI